MKCFCMDRQVTELGKNYKYVKYVYRFLAEGEKKPETIKIKRTSEDHWTEIGKFKTSIKDANGKAIGWVAEHMFQRKPIKQK